MHASVLVEQAHEGPDHPALHWHLLFLETSSHTQVPCSSPVDTSKEGNDKSFVGYQMDEQNERKSRKGLLVE